MTTDTLGVQGITSHTSTPHTKAGFQVKFRLLKFKDSHFFSSRQDENQNENSSLIEKGQYTVKGYTYTFFPLKSYFVSLQSSYIFGKS